MIMTGKRQHLSSKLHRLFPIARISENPERGRSNDIRLTPIGRDDFGRAKRGAALRTVRLIGSNRDGDHRDTRNQRFLDAVEAGMSDKDVAVRKQQGLRHVLLQAKLGGMGPKRAGFWSGPTVTTRLTGSWASPSIMVSRIPGVVLNTVPKLARTVGRSGRPWTQWGKDPFGLVAFAWRRNCVLPGLGASSPSQAGGMKQRWR